MSKNLIAFFLTFSWVLSSFASTSGNAIIFRANDVRITSIDNDEIDIENKEKQFVLTPGEHTIIANMVEGYKPGGVIDMMANQQRIISTATITVRKLTFVAEEGGEYLLDGEKVTRKLGPLAVKATVDAVYKIIDKKTKTPVDFVQQKLFGEFDVLYDFSKTSHPANLVFRIRPNGPPLGESYYIGINDLKPLRVPDWSEVKVIVDQGDYNIVIYRQTYRQFESAQFDDMDSVTVKAGESVKYEFKGSLAARGTGILGRIEEKSFDLAKTEEKSELKFSIRPSGKPFKGTFYLSVNGGLLPVSLYQDVSVVVDSGKHEFKFYRSRAESEDPKKTRYMEKVKVVAGEKASYEFLANPKNRNLGSMSRLDD